MGFHWLPSWSQSLHSLMPRRVRAFFAPCSVHWNCLTISLSVWLFAVCCVSHCGTGRRGRGSVADEAGRKALESASRNTVYDIIVSLPRVVVRRESRLSTRGFLPGNDATAIGASARSCATVATTTRDRRS